MLPKKLYRVTIERGGRGRLRFYQKGGGTYMHRDLAFGQARRLRAQEVRAQVYETDVDWQLIPEDEWMIDES